MGTRGTSSCRADLDYQFKRLVYFSVVNFVHFPRAQLCRAAPEMGRLPSVPDPHSRELR